MLYLIAPLLAETTEEAQDRARRRNQQTAKNLDVAMAWLGWITNIDFSKFDLDAPVGDLTTNGHQESLAQFLKGAGKRTLRDTFLDYSTSGLSVELVGTPDQVAPPNGRGDGGGRRRRLSVLHAEYQPPHHGRDHRRADPRAAAARSDAPRPRPQHLRDNLREF